MIIEGPKQMHALPANAADGLSFVVPTCVPVLPWQDEVLRVCAWCRRIPLEPDFWVKMEEAVQVWPLLSPDMLKRATHGVCPECKDAFLSREQAVTN
jgi:hypothetical protein